MVENGRTDILIIGAGILGSSTAYHLAKMGAEVTLVERGMPGMEASGRNAGTLAIQVNYLDAVPFLCESVRRWNDMSAELEHDFEVHQTGGLRVAESPEQVAKLQQLMGEWQRRGARAEMVGGSELDRMAPYMEGRVLAAGFCPDEGSANPRMAGWAFSRAAAKRGTKLQFETEVKRLAQDNDGFVVDTSRGRWRARRVVIAAGAWAKDLVAQVGIQLPTYVRHLQVHVSEPAAPYFPHVVSHVAEKLTLKQSHAGNFVIGGGWFGEGEMAEGSRRSGLHALSGNPSLAARVVPGLKQLRIIRSWTGYDHTSPDHYPIMGEVPGLPGLYLLTAVRGGFTLGPLMGHLMSELILAGRTSMDVAPFHMRRFS